MAKVLMVRKETDGPVASVGLLEEIFGPPAPTVTRARAEEIRSHQRLGRPVFLGCSRRKCQGFQKTNCFNRSQVRCGRCGRFLANIGG